MLAYNVYVYCANNPVSLSDLTGEGIFSAVIGNELVYFLYILETVGLGSVLIWAIVGAVISTTVVMAAMKIYQMSKGGKQNIRDTGLIGTTDEEIESRIKDPSTSKSEKERLKKEQKARGYRNKKKREQMK